MSSLRRVFSSSHVVLPVIHVSGCKQALRNTLIAGEAGADGVFLIGHGMPHGALLEIYREVVEAFPDWWIGLNCLDLNPEDVFSKIPPETSGVWVDNAQIDEHRTSQPRAEKIKKAQTDAGWKGLYFGGVAFKYQREVSDLANAAQIAAKYIDVVTTSGPGTGHAASVEKIRMMKAALGNHPLAIASGITPENVADYLPYADCFLVATGISKAFDELDADKVKLLIERKETAQDD